jgi:hypothetical protein
LVCGSVGADGADAAESLEPFPTVHIETRRGCEQTSGKGCSNDAPHDLNEFSDAFVAFRLLVFDME